MGTITQNIEEAALELAESENWSEVHKWLRDLNLTEEEIYLAIEHWQSGKSFYPYKH